jgi:hypothetical protein
VLEPAVGPAVDWADAHASAHTAGYPLMGRGRDVFALAALYLVSVPVLCWAVRVRGWEAPGGRARLGFGASVLGCLGVAVCCLGSLGGLLLLSRLSFLPSLGSRFSTTSLGGFFFSVSRSDRSSMHGAWFSLGAFVGAVFGAILGAILG